MNLVLDFKGVTYIIKTNSIHSVKESGNEDQWDMLDTLITGKRLRDISDLPFDLVS